jgi:hypothetical protein
VDKYVEMELVIIFLDLLLLRPQVYRHLLFNRIPYREHGLDVRHALHLSRMYVRVRVRACVCDLTSGAV